MWQDCVDLDGMGGGGLDGCSPSWLPGCLDTTLQEYPHNRDFVGNYVLECAWLQFGD
jgi:hypothetical protein